jgi:hypothetical protein
VIQCGSILEGPSTSGLSQLCNYGYIENSAYAFTQIAESPKLLLIALVGIFDISFFNYFGISITKYATASNRVTVDLLRILFVWIFSVLFGLEEFNLSLLPGFLILCLGFIIYNEIWLVPLFNLDKIPNSNKVVQIEITGHSSKNDSLIGYRGRPSYQDDNFGPGHLEFKRD